ncbi:EpsG family protein [Luteimonas sp. Sa2BVA3]|uniref:EpsG family protein n=1 Tax=Luteimonas colneyensis TaxID=2762230 RepID=A0ABR8UL55_9GAMM|nr:EpsG family protein [Luteimonas colneyensis]MBD7988319.1 EpsG family protein [Luteimonas colneyensis]
MHVYLLVYLLAAGSAFLVRSPRRSWHLAILTGVFLALFIGTRHEVGCDFTAYAARYESLYPATVGWLQGLQMGEGGFHIINILSRDLGWGFRGVVMLCAILYAWGLVRFSRLAPRPMAFVAIAIPILVVQLGMSGMRQATATALLMLAYVAFTQRRQWLTAGWIGLAFLFHESAIAFLPMALLARRQISAKYLVVGVILLAPLAGMLLGERLDVYSARYVDQIYGENSAGGAWIRYAIAATPLFLCWWKRGKVQAAFPTLYPLLWIFMLITMALVLVGGVSSVALHRLTFYVLPVSLLALLCVVECAFAPTSRRLAWGIPFAMYGLYIVSWFTMSRHGTSCYIPYQSWLLQ